jgi:hypothetical protein
MAMSGGMMYDWYASVNPPTVPSTELKYGASTATTEVLITTTARMRFRVHSVADPLDGFKSERK